MEANKERRSNFIWDFIDEDLAAGKNGSRVHTRFPPEPNGYLHIGHCKALYVDFVTAQRYGGLCNLRFDDTNPTKEETEYVDAIMDDIHWMGFNWDGGLFYASDYSQETYDLACRLIRNGDAYVDELSQEEMRAYRGTLTEPGKNSPWRDRPIAESLRLFEEMRDGKHPEGSLVLRAKIDMASPNVLMRDPAIYRILYKEHHRTGNTWCIYPMYDFAHPIGDALEGITHSLCSLEYEIHRPLYDWVVEKCGFEHKPRQIEFARLNLTRTIMSKRYLRALVEGGYVNGWDDPRMPTLHAMRRRGYPPEAIIDFIERAGISKADSVVDLALLEHCVREALGETAPRAMAVLKPLKVTLTNWPEEKLDTLEMENHPAHPEMGTHTANFGRTLYVEQEDFMLDPPKKFFRLRPDGEVRLKGAYIIRCDEAIQDDEGNVIELRCTVDMDSRSGSPGADRKVKGTLHWVNASDAVPMTVRLYEPLLNDETGIVEDEAAEEGAAVDKKDFIRRLNPNSVTELTGCMGEALLGDADNGACYQFLRSGYFAKDSDSTPGAPIYNRTVSLKDSWSKQNKS